MHSAALDSRRNLSSVTLLSRVGKKSATPECAHCAFCQRALECIAVQADLNELPARQWQSLWHDRFEGVAAPSANL